MSSAGGMVEAESGRRRPLKDQLTPYKLALLVVTKEYCHSRGPRGEPCFSQDSYSDQEERELLFTLCNLVQSVDVELKELVVKLQSVCKSRLLDGVTEKLKEVHSNGIDCLMDLMSSLPELFADNKSGSKPLLHKSSVLGFFVRRMQLAYDRLPFSDITKLQSLYKVFYEQYKPVTATSVHGTSDMLEISEIGDASLSIIEILGRGGDREDTRTRNMHNMSVLDAGRYSQRQAEYFIAQQASLLHHNEPEALPPKQLHGKITQLLQSNKDLAEAHYLSYLNNLRVLEYCGAKEQLHCYFDKVQVSSAAASGKSSEEQQVSRQSRFAALNLASLHYRFGHRDDALAAVQEAIRMAQEVNDPVCLQHALSWLQRLGGQGNSGTAYLLDRLVTKSGELVLPYLTSLGVQALARHNALSTANPSNVFEYLLKSDILNCQYCQSDLMCISYAQKAALWNMYGLQEMCSLSCQLMLHLNTIEGTVYHNGEPECLVLCQLARQHADQGEYDMSLDILASLKQRFPPTSAHAPIWQLHEQQMLFDRAVNLGKWHAAEQAVMNITTINTLEAAFCHCTLLKEKGETSTASQQIHTMIEKCKHAKSDDVHIPTLLARFLILQADLFCATMNPTLAGQSLLMCLTLCQEHNLQYLQAIATLHLAYVQFCLALPLKAQRLIDRVLPKILAHGSLYYRARAQYLSAKCQVAASVNRGKEEREKAIMTSITAVNEVLSWFRKLEAFHRLKEATHYQAELYHELGFQSEANQCALEFKNLNQQFPLWRATTL